MSMDTLTRDIAIDASMLFKNKNLKAKDIVEWCTNEIKPGPGEVTAQIPDKGGFRYTGVFVTILKTCDKRPRSCHCLEY